MDAALDHNSILFDINDTDYSFASTKEQEYLKESSKRRQALTAHYFLSDPKDTAVLNGRDAEAKIKLLKYNHTFYSEQQNRALLVAYFQNAAAEECPNFLQVIGMASLFRDVNQEKFAAALMQEFFKRNNLSKDKFLQMSKDNLDDSKGLLDPAEFLSIWLANSENNLTLEELKFAVGSIDKLATASKDAAPARAADSDDSIKIDEFSLNAWLRKPENNLTSRQLLDFLPRRRAFEYGTRDTITPVRVLVAKWVDKMLRAEPIAVTFDNLKEIADKFGAIPETFTKFLEKYDCTIEQLMSLDGLIYKGGGSSDFYSNEFFIGKKILLAWVTKQERSPEEITKLARASGENVVAMYEALLKKDPTIKKLKYFLGQLDAVSAKHVSNSYKKSFAIECCADPVLREKLDIPRIFLSDEIIKEGQSRAEIFRFCLSKDKDIAFEKDVLLQLVRENNIGDQQVFNDQMVFLWIEKKAPTLSAQEFIDVCRTLYPTATLSYKDKGSRCRSCNEALGRYINNLPQDKKLDSLVKVLSDEGLPYKEMFTDATATKEEIDSFKQLLADVTSRRHPTLPSGQKIENLLSEQLYGKEDSADKAKFLERFGEPVARKPAPAPATAVSAPKVAAQKTTKTTSKLCVVQ